MNKYDTLILSWIRTFTIGDNISLPYDSLLTAELYEDDEVYILIKLAEPVKSLGTMFLVKNIIFN